jgi:hypothetical protein
MRGWYVDAEHLAHLREPRLLAGTLRAGVRRLGRERDGGRTVVAFEILAHECDGPRPDVAADATGFADEDVDPEGVVIRADVERRTMRS